MHYLETFWFHFAVYLPYTKPFTLIYLITACVFFCKKSYGVNSILFNKLYIQNN